MYVDKTILIILLCITAGILSFIEFGTSPAKADTVWKDRDYQMITARGSNGGQDLFILDSRLGSMLVLVYDTTRRTSVTRQAVSLPDLFTAPVR